MTRQTIPQSVKTAIRDKYAWPGGYPMFVVMNDGGALCVECAHQQYRQIAHDTVKQWQTGWDAAAGDINYEDNSLQCEHCGNQIEAAYND